MEQGNGFLHPFQLVKLPALDRKLLRGILGRLWVSKPILVYIEAWRPVKVTASGNAQRANDSMICAILETKKM